MIDLYWYAYTVVVLEDDNYGISCLMIARASIYSTIFFLCVQISSCIRDQNGDLSDTHMILFSSNDDYDTVHKKIFQEFGYSFLPDAKLQLNNSIIGRSSFRSLEKCLGASRLTQKTAKLCINLQNEMVCDTCTASVKLIKTLSVYSMYTGV